MTLIVCPVSVLDEVIAEHAPSRVVTLLSDELMIETPENVEPHRHLRLFMNDIDQPMDGYEPPNAGHVERLIEFVDVWEKDRPIVIHCWAGISRSTAAAYAALCHLNPDASEDDLAWLMRRASPMASPNRMIVRLADEFLGRSGRMVEAIAAIGRGRETWENEVFSLPSRLGEGGKG